MATGPAESPRPVVPAAPPSGPHAPPPRTTLRTITGAGTRRLLGQAWSPVAISAGCAALAGAALGARVPGPATAPMAALGPAAGLAAQGAVLLGICLAWQRGRSAAREHEGLIPHARVRGAGHRQVARLLLAFVLPLLALAAAAAVVEGRLAAGVVAAAVAHFAHAAPSPLAPPAGSPASPAAAASAASAAHAAGPGPHIAVPPAHPTSAVPAPGGLPAPYIPHATASATPGLPPPAAIDTVRAATLRGILRASLAAGVAPADILWRALQWSVAAALATALAAAAGFTLVLFRRPEHHRRAAAARPTWARHLWPDALLLLVGAAVATAVGSAGPPGAAGAGVAAVFGGIPFVGAVADHAHLSLPTAYLGAAAALLGAGMLAGRLLSLGVRTLEHRRDGHLSVVAVLAARAVGRGASPLRLALLPALATATVLFAVSGALGAARTDRMLRSLEVGAPLRIGEQWTSGCADGCSNPRAMPILPIATWNADAPGVTAAATLLSIDSSVHAAAGYVPAQLLGITPGAFAQTADWRFLPDGPAALRAMAAAPSPGGAVISAALAQGASLGAGDILDTSSLPPLRIVAVEPGWPGLGLGRGRWAVVPQSLIRAYLQSGLRYSLAGVASILLARLRPGASVSGITANIRGHHAVVTSVAVSGSGGWGLGALPVTVLPEVVGLLLLCGMALRTSPVDPGSLPEGDALAALGAAAEAECARRRVRHLVTGWGPAFGAAAGTCLAPLFWRALRLGSPALDGVPFQAVWWGLPLAGLLLAAGTRGLIGAIRSEPPPETDPVIAERVATDRFAAGAPDLTAVILGAPHTPPGEEAGREPSGVSAAGARPPAPRGTAALTRGIRALSAGARAVAAAGRGAVLAPALARRRLAATWTRLPGLAAGMLLAAAVAAVVPLFTAGALTRVLHAGLPGENDRPSGALLLSDFPPPGVSAGTANLARLAALAASVGAAAGTAQTPPVNLLVSGVVQVRAAPGSGAPIPAPYLQVATIAGLAAHAHFERGGPPPAAPEPDGTIDVAATARAAADLPLRFGRVYVTARTSGAPLRIRLTGIFTEVPGDGTYWPYLYPDQDVFAAPALWRQVVLVRHALPVGEATWYTVLHLGDLTAQQVPAAVAGLGRVDTQAADAAPGTSLAVSPVRQLQGFLVREATLGALLRLAGVPVLALTLYFVAITAGLVVAAEGSEISVLLGRGAAAAQVATVYLAEWILLAIPLVAVAPFPAVLLARAMGAADGFLRFAPRAPLPVFLQVRDFAYAGGAALLAVLAALLPVLGAVGGSTVEARARMGRTPAPPLWQRTYLDAALLAVLVVSWAFLRGAKLQGAGAAAVAGDPALYVLPAVLLAAAGFLGVRFLGWIFRRMDALWGTGLPLPVSLSLRRIGRLPAQFAPVLLLLCFTAGLGTYSAAAARTLDQNLADTVHYQVGAPVRIVESSPCTLSPIAPPVCTQYGLRGPSPRPLPPFRANLQVPGVRSATQMLELPITVVAAGTGGIPATLVLVDTANFAATAWWPADLNPLPEARYLQSLGSAPNAVLVSPGLPGGGGGPLTAQLSGGPQADLHSVGTVPRWPGTDAAGPIIVAPLSAAVGVFRITCASPTAPCAGERIVLVSLAPGTTAAAVDAALPPLGFAVARTDVAAVEEAAAIATPEWAGQTGLLTIGFLIALAVTAVGYLLYAAVVLRGQTAQLGLLRAVGLRWSTLVGSVAVEQGALVVAGGIVGVIAGRIAAALFLPLFSPAFTGPNAPPFLVEGPGGALREVAGLFAGLLAVVLGLLLVLLRRMHIGETVKLED